MPKGEIIHWAKVRERDWQELEGSQELATWGLVATVIGRANETIDINGMRENRVTVGEGYVVVQIIRGNPEAIQLFYEWVDSVKD